MFNVLYGNARSVIKKVNELRAHVYDRNPDFVLLTETWTNQQHPKAYLSIPGFEVVCRKDREDTSCGIGGGLLIYAKIGLVCSAYTITAFDNYNQCCAIKLPITGGTELYIVLIYRPHHIYHNTHILVQETLDNNTNLCSILNKIPRPCVLIGDFNYSCIDWDTLSCSSSSKHFLCSVQDNFFTQHVQFDTHISGTRPDLVLSSSPGLVLGVESAGRLGTSDHTMMMVTVMGEVRANVTHEEVPDWRNADMDRFREELSSVDWVNSLADLNAVQSWEKFKEFVKQAEERCVPMKRRRVGSKPLWMNRNVLRTIRKKRRLWKTYQNTKDYKQYEAYKMVEKEVRNTVKRAKRKFEKKLAKQAKKNPKAFYSYLKSNTANRQSVGPLKDKDNIVSDDKEMVELLNAFFTSVFTEEDLSNVPQIDKLYNGDPLTSVSFLPEQVKEKILKVRTTSAAGPDKFYPRLLKEAADCLSVPLAIIYTRSLKEGVIPDDWRNANITPVFKSGPATSAGNYRPISLTSILSKIAESIIRDAIVSHMALHQLIRPSQHGFMARKSCQTNLLEYLEVLTNLVDNGHDVDVLYLDFSKAFDKVPHQRLLNKIEAHGISGDILQWISAWLTGRRQRVVLNGVSSEWSEVTSGVPQGSVLGPTCFVIFINDIDAVVDLVSGFISKFADDTKFGRKIVDDNDRAAMQEDINNLMNWAELWQMEFNLDKCKLLHIGRTNPKFNYTMGGYAPAGTIIKVVEEEKDIGVIIHKSLKPTMQCAKAAKKANQVLGQMARSFHYRDRSVWINLYKKYVRPHLEFAVQAWSPWTKADKELIESVQQRAVRMVSGLKGKTYEDRLREIGLTTLEARRIRGDMIQVWKILHEQDDVKLSTWFIMASDQQGQTTRHTSNLLNIAKPKAKLEVRANFFSVRCVQCWNNLPIKLRSATSVNEFKIAYDNHIG